MVGFVGVPHGVELPIGDMFFRNMGVRGGSAPARAYIPELLPDVLEGRINPGRVLDYETGLEGIADAYAAMDERRAIKALVRVGACDDRDGTAAAVPSVIVFWTSRPGPAGTEYRERTRAHPESDLPGGGRP